jgi:hypothetical protein
VRDPDHRLGGTGRTSIGTCGRVVDPYDGTSGHLDPAATSLQNLVIAGLTSVGLGIGPLGDEWFVR